MKEQINIYEQKLKCETDSWDLYESLERDVKVVVINARSAEVYADEHIPTAVNLPHRSMNEEKTAEFDRSYLYVTYCDGINCNASTKGH